MKDNLPKVRTANHNLIEVRNIYCVGRNFISHTKELNNIIPDNPVFFQKKNSQNLSTQIDIFVKRNDEK